MIAKAEHLHKGPNPRFVVTSLSSEQMAAQELYEKGYCARGDCPENRIKEQQLDLFADRTSTGKMWTNQLRLYFSSMAYVLLQTLRRLALSGSELATAQCGTIRLKLLKIGAQVRVTVRKVQFLPLRGIVYGCARHSGRRPFRNVDPHPFAVISYLPSRPTERRRPAVSVPFSTHPNNRFSALRYRDLARPPPLSALCVGLRISSSSAH